MSRIGAMVAIALSGITLAACATEQTDNANWLVNSQERTYVEIPKTFKRFSVNPYRVNKFDQEAERIGGIGRDPANWLVVFDSAKKAKVDNFDIDRPAALVGMVAVYTLNSDWTQTPNFRNGVNITTLRTYPFGSSAGVDPVSEFNDGNPDLELVSYTEDAGKNGIRGVKVRFNQRISESEWVTVDQQAFTNRDTTKLYVLTMKCSSTCFKANYDTARKISASFTVQK